jgi:glycosyltransferase involved in cell wall biosynthesis
MSAPAGKRPIRVLHIITRMIVGGAQENTMLSCALIDPQRYPSDLLCGPETGAEGSLHEECRARGVRVHIEPSLVRRVHPWLDLVATVRLTQFIRRGRYDVVHTHSSKAGIVGRVAARLAGTPVIIHTAHGWAFTRRDSPAHRALWVFLERVCSGLCDALIVVGNADREDGLALGVGRGKPYHLIRSGIELDVYSHPTVTREAMRARIGVPRDALVVICVGRLARQKAPLELLAAFEHLAGARGDAHLVMVGDGPQREEVQAAVARMGLQDRVHLLGLRRDVPELMHAADVFALSSHWEGLPRVFPQAMAAGLPIVATRVAGAADAIDPGDNGWLVEVGDMDGFGRHLIALASDPELRSRMGARGRQRVEEFSARRMVEQLGALYQALLARRNGR